jgi:hypothetical protein
LCDRSLKAWEAIVSSPIHLDEDIDIALIYTPPWARGHIPSVAESTLQAQGAIVAAAEMSTKRLRPKFSGDRAMLELQRQLALDPDLIPGPSSEAAAVIQSLLTRVCSVSAVAALVAWGLASYSSVKKNAENVPAATSIAAVASNPVNVVDVQSLRLRPTISRTAETLAGKPEPVTVATAASEAATPPAASVTTSVPADGVGMQLTPPERAMDYRQLRLGSEEIDVLIKRGKDLLADGDVAAARLLFRRAAEAGSAEGAFTLGTTFDPVALKRLGAIGAAPDLAQARQWYRRAAELGSSAAKQQLAGLGDSR